MQSRNYQWLWQQSRHICSRCRQDRTGLLRRYFASLVRSRHQRVVGQKETLSFQTLNWRKEHKKFSHGGTKTQAEDSVLKTLEERGFVNQIIGERTTLDKLLTGKRAGAYVGVDPTAHSVHIGHLVPLMALFWMYAYGYPATSLLGGATASIGDPSGRTAARVQQSALERRENVISIWNQLKTLWENVTYQLHSRGNTAKLDIGKQLLNNDRWLSELPLLEALKVMAPGMRMGAMLGRDSVKLRMQSGSGISMAEFCYPLLQAWDWWHMYTNYDIQIQIGGSDQFGNILAGVDAINYVRKTEQEKLKRETDKKALIKPHREPVGFTVPLLTTSSGEKFGKSAGNAIWLDPTMTSPFDLYQFFLRTSDADVHRYLKLFTFEPLPALQSLVNSHLSDPSLRRAQHKLAKEVLTIVHGPQIARDAEREHEVLFQQPSQSTSKADSTQPLAPYETPTDSNADAIQSTIIALPNPTATLPLSLIRSTPLPKLLYHASLTTSRSEGHQICNNGGIYIGMPEKTTGRLQFHTPTSSSFGGWKGNHDCGHFVIKGDTIVLRIGKTKVRVIEVVSDEDYEKGGMTFVGYDAWKEEQRVKSG